MTGRAIPARLPGTISLCARCGEPIAWARTVVSERGTGGKLMPLNVKPDPAGNVAVRELSARLLRARVLTKDEHHDVWSELLAMPHAATCAGSKPAAEAPPDELAARRARKAGR